PGDAGGRAFLQPYLTGPRSARSSIEQAGILGPRLSSDPEGCANHRRLGRRRANRHGARERGADAAKIGPRLRRNGEGNCAGSEVAAKVLAATWKAGYLDFSIMKSTALMMDLSERS